MTQQQRILALVAVIAVLGLVLVSDLGSTPPSAAPGASPGASVAAPGSALLPGAPPGLDGRALAARYAPVLTARPFAVRSFRPAPRERPRPAPGPDRPPTRDEPPRPQDLELLLTGTIGVGPGRIAFLEHRGSGRALEVREGDRVGPTTVAKVETAALVLSEGEKTRRLELGEILNLPSGEERALKPLRTGPPPAETPKPGAGADPSTPAPNAEDRAALLERLRQRRQASMQPKPEQPAPEQPSEPEASKGDE